MMNLKWLIFSLMITCELLALNNNLLKIKYKNDLNLTDQEIQWLSENPDIKFAVMSFWPKDEKGGDIHYDLIDLLNSYGKLNIVPVTFNVWDNGYAQAKEGKNIKAIMNLGWSKQRESEDFYFSKSYDYKPLYIISKSTKDHIQNFDSLEGKTVLLQKDTTAIELFKNSFFNIYIQQVKNDEDIYSKFKDSFEAEAIADTQIDYQKIKEMDYKIVDTLYDKYAEISVGITKNAPLLHSIIQKVIDVIPANEFAALKNKGKLVFTPDEQKWMTQNPVVKYVYDPFYNPIEFKDEINAHEGIIKDILSLVGQKSSLTLEVIQSVSREDSIGLVRDGRIPMFSGSVANEELEKEFQFTSNPFLSIPYVFVSQKDLKFDNGFQSLSDKKVGILKAHQVDQLINQITKNVNLIEMESTQLLFENLFEGDVDVLVLDATTAKYHLDLRADEEYQITYKTIFNQDLKVMFHKAVAPQLVSIINKSIEHIPKQEINDIVHKWTQVTIDKSTDWIFILKVTGGIIVVLIIVFINNRQLKSLVNRKTKDLQNQTKELENLLYSFDKNVVTVKIDLEGKITHVSEAFCKVSGYTNSELEGEHLNIIRHSSVPKELLDLIDKSLKREKSIIKEMKNTTKQGEIYWVEEKFGPDYDVSGKLIGYSSIGHDITSKKEVEELKDNLEIKVEERTKDLNETKQEVEQILQSILLPVLITDKNTKEIIYANEFAQTQYDLPLEQILGSNVENLYETKGNDELIDAMKLGDSIANVEQQFITKAGKEFTALLSAIPINYQKRESYIGMTADITKQKNIEEEIRQIHKHTRDSIEYASLIQHAIVAHGKDLEKYFSASFAHWEPKDVVGGDIWLFEQLNENECIIYCIDCTGHGVPGAFVTMLVKAVERQVSAFIQNNSFVEISPAWILSYFNKTIKMLLKQETQDSISNAGFDGGVIYYNKKEKLIKFSGAETPLFYVTKDGELKTLKGSRHSVGYKKSDPDYEFKEHSVEVEEGMKFYITTDGYLDQNGGEKEFPFGKKKFGKLIDEYNTKSFEEQRKIFMDTIENYQGSQDRNDDITVIGIEI